MSDWIKDIQARHEDDAKQMLEAGQTLGAGHFTLGQAHYDRGILLDLLTAETARADGLQVRLDAAEMEIRRSIDFDYIEYPQDKNNG